MRSFEAAMKAVMADRSVAAAVAGLLMQDAWDLRGHLIGRNLVRTGEVLSGELITAENRGEGPGWSLGIECGNVC